MSLSDLMKAAATAKKVQDAELEGSVMKIQAVVRGRNSRRRNKGLFRKKARQVLARVRMASAFGMKKGGFALLAAQAASSAPANTSLLDV